jgi:pyridine nucleotide-disulfide oxidoreductase family protein
MKRLILAGAGHAHAQVLLAWAQAPLPGVELVVVSPQALAPYSGMVPGWLAGHYRFDEIVVDFPALCQRAGARWVQDEVHSLDPDGQTLRLAGGVPMAYDVLSLNLGSTLRPPPVEQAPVLSLRPLAHLRQAYERLLQTWTTGAAAAGQARRPFQVTAVGGGAAGFESLLAVLARLQALQPQRELAGSLVSRGSELLPGLSAPARRAAQRKLQQAKVSLHLQSDWAGSEQRSTSDLVLWATGAEAHDWQRDPQRRGSLAVNAQGFVGVNAQLQSSSHPTIFAVGDCAHWDTGEQPLPKAGVYAVRMGPVLLKNLRSALQGTPLARYEPQRQFLVLLATADHRAIASRGRWGFEGAWAWRWKDHIDRGFLARFGPSR